ncbi:unhealthy ribosome biogenesis protein 2 homolog [Octopus bimaculoides]|nr:unhealthy ribosome biogenesis protein 2 homolog [Octopus bimaculoides]|eukprot:XP_014784498.1 PREDICTED: unhealthy ribosome biogenesis protein 2 homolog [Octopus bimaculoides]
MSVRHVVPGVFIRLKSITTPLNVKLKLVKYLWISESVIIPNKTEVLLDFIVGLLLNKKRKNLSDEDFEAIWHCLEWLLLTKKMQQRLSKKQVIVLKPSFSSMLISSLTNVSQNKLKYSDSVIVCCKLLLSSPALSCLFTSNIENMANLLSAVSSISLQQLATTGHMEQHIDDMLTSLIKSFCDCQKISCNQVQVLKLFCNKLFQSVLILRYKCQHRSDYNHISCLLDEMIKNTVFNKDQRLFFRKFQKLSAATNILEIKSRLSQLFTIMEEAITRTDNEALAVDFRAAVLDYLPKLFALFIEGETESSVLIEIMLDNISKLLGFDLEQGKFHGAVEENKAIEIMGQLLDSISNMNIYNLNADDDNEKKFWFMYSKQLPQILFTAERKTDSWFLCLKSLILLNPDISKEYLDHILSLCWSVLSESDESTIEQVDGLLESILEVYSKLRQMPFLFEKLIASVIASSVEYNCKWSQRFSVKFQNIVQVLPQTVALQIWEMLLTAIEKELSPMLKDDEGDDSISNQKHVCSCIIGLLLNFLGDVVIVGPSVTAKNTLAMQNLQTRMKVSIVVPSIYLYLSKPNCDPHLLEATLLLIYKWWEIAFILAYYTPPGQEEFLFDLSTFNFLSASIRKKIFKSGGNGSVVCYLLQLQCIKAVQVFPESETEKKKAKICDLSGIVNMLMSKENSEVPVENQNKIVHPHIPVRTMKQATWWFLTTNLPILFPLFTPQNILVISQYIVQTLITDTVEHSEREMLTEASFTWNLIRSPFFQEMASFHTHIITCIFSTLAGSVLKKDGSLPEDMKTVASLFSTLGNSELQWNNPNDKNTSKALKIVGGGLCSLFENSVAQSDAQENFLQKSSTIIKIVELLPLRFLPRNEKIQIIFGLHLVISCCSVSDICPDDSNLVSTVPNDQKLSLLTNCTDCLSTLMKSSENVSIYNYLRPEVVLNFLETSLSKIQEQKSNSQQTLLMCYYRLLEYSISSMFEGSTLCSILETYIMKLFKYLQKAKDRISKRSHSMEYIQKKYSLKFLFASKFIEELGKVLQQKTLSEDTHAIATKYMEMFSDVVLEMINSIDSEVADCVLAVYTSLLESRKNTSNGQKALSNKHNPRLTVCCLNNISKMENFTSLLLSVQFFKFSLNHASAVISPEEHSNLWNCLKDLLSFLLTSSTVTQKTQSSSAASVESSLNTAVAFSLLSSFSGLQLASLCAPSSTITNGSQLQFYSRQNCIQSLYIAVKSTMLSLISAMSCEEQHIHLENLALCLKTDVGLNNFTEITTATEVFQVLLEKNVFDENAQLQKTILNSTQLMFQQLQWHCNMDKMTKIYIPLLHLEVKMLKKNIPPQTALHIIFGCQFVPLSNLDAATFEAVFQALYDVLNILLTEYTDVILLTLPSFIGIVKRLIVAVVGEGTQDKLSNNKSAEKAICNCANLLSRLINSMSIHKSELNSVVNYVIAEFIAAYSNVTLLPTVKNILNSSLYCLLMSCNNHMLNSLNAILPQSMKHVFESIYKIYSKNYEYKGYI